MTLRSILLSYAGIALVAVGFSFSLMTTNANAKPIYNDQLPRIGIPARLDFDAYKYWK